MRKIGNHPLLLINCCRSLFFKLFVDKLIVFFLMFEFISRELESRIKKHNSFRNDYLLPSCLAQIEFQQKNMPVHQLNSQKQRPERQQCKYQEETLYFQPKILKDKKAPKFMLIHALYAF